MRTVALIPKRSKPEAVALAEKVADWLIERGMAVLSEDAFAVRGTTPVPGSALAQAADLVVVLGGDGTLLHAARLTSGHEVPILGVNYGSLGFMTDVPREKTFEALEHTLAGRYTLEKRTKLSVEIVRGDKTIHAGEVLNDAVIAKTALARIADLETNVAGGYLATFRADGVIISTPTGSSAYSLAAGGPLLHPGVRAIVVTPICPHTFTQRPIVLPEDVPIELKLLSDDEMFATLDGQSGLPLKRSDRVLVRRSPTGIVLVRSDQASYFAVLRNKLRWGER